MNQKQRQRWEKLRSRGMKSYIINYGVLLFGGLMVIFGLFGVNIYSILVLEDGTWSDVADWLLSVEFVISFFVYTVIFGTAGYLWGRFMWNEMERKYNQKVQTR